jgi:hypothetical protein
MGGQRVENGRNRKATFDFFWTCVVIVWMAFAYALWERLFLIILYGRTAVDRQGLTILHGTSRGDPTYLSNGEALSPAQDLFWVIGWLLLAAGVPYLVDHCYRKWSATDGKRNR